MSDKNQLKLLRLPSVGEWIDVNSHELYPELDTKTPDLSAFLPTRLSDALNDAAWKKMLSVEDAQRLNRNLEFVGGEDV